MSKFPREMKLPCQVRLRNQETAYVQNWIELAEFRLEGRREKGDRELWRADGAWRADGTEHVLDIVMVCSASGHIYALKAEKEAPL